MLHIAKIIRIGDTSPLSLC